jgi:hypothetical protein
MSELPPVEEMEPLADASFAAPNHAASILSVASSKAVVAPSSNV